ncbi:MAG: hypothetical protein E7658_02865 [Ruminococcaceae bacterium]|nr:hypothetical protein [Oscillospiraceae bacterium]
MKNTKSIFLALFLGVLLFVGCGETTVDETDTAETAETVETEISTNTVELTPANHDILVGEVQSILAENGLRTNLNSYNSPSEMAVYHGGQQMRVVHTERGTYTAFCKEPGEYNGTAEYYVAKVDKDNNVFLLYYGTYTCDHSTILVNIGQDINGDIVVTVGSPKELDVCVFDHETDEMAKYSAVPEFMSGSQPAYSQPLFDFVNRKIYMFYCGTDFAGNGLQEWFTFDMETMTWDPQSRFVWIYGGRHCYLYPFPDGNGGAYILGQRDLFLKEPQADKLNIDKEQRIYLFDQLDLYHIPDLTSSENVTCVSVQEVYDERGAEGIWSGAGNNMTGDVFVDAAGKMHITYMYGLYDYSGNHPDLDGDFQYRHAIYDGMECIFNEKITFSDPEYFLYNPLMMQDTAGNLFMIVCKQGVIPIELEIYKANDALGTSWELVKTHVFTELPATTWGFSISAVRDGSVQDNTVSCFFYYYNGPDKTPFVFNLSLEDYSITEPVGILRGFDLYVEDRVDIRVPASAHQNQVIHTENGTYAAFVYNHIGVQKTDQFYIVKIETDNTVKLLHSDSYTSEQDKYLTMQRLDDGMIYICPPTGNTMYTVDPADDVVTLHKTTDKRIPAMLTPQQTDLITDPASGTAYALSSMSPQYFGFSSQVLDTQVMTVDKASTKYVPDTDFIGEYTGFYTLNDNNGGVYLVGTRTITRDDLTDKLHYAGHIASINDGVTLFHIPALAEASEVQKTDIFLPDETRGNEGIWSVADIGNCGDVYLDAGGKLHIFYTTYLFDFDDADRPGNAALAADTLKHYHAVYDGTTLVSNEEIGIAGLTKDTSVRMAETTDGTLYLLICNIGEAEARIDIYFETENGLALAQTKTLGEFVAESFSISGPRGGSVQDNTVDCIIYGTDNDVYYTAVTFE